ncbi:amino acid ABC transporter permease [Anaerostipes sp. MSJ-23]|uniref:amino acid ABC transporter permease n=1 Tax=Anaerostipes sp. MSJ-23 TaxID=2841520 RepID=UPI001C11B669|nr:amino acid ABC transporter permease [Anaerostipes sp. MSJ-23]MBU5459239.1 amino acid ABC transporter permease [Anaerostipes sp. MSJ-23]
MQDLGIKILLQGDNLVRLLQGLGVTISISVISVLLSLAFGVLLGIVMMVKNPLIRFITRLYLEFIRIMPQLVLLFLVYFGSAKHLGWDLGGETASVIVFVLWGTAEMGDLVRGALQSISVHQTESGKALGLTKGQIYYYILIPQAVKRLIPQAMNLVTRMIKTTSLIVLIGVVEVVKTGQQIIESARLTSPSAALWIYGVIFFMYFIICYPISLIAGHLEKVWKE